MAARRAAVRRPRITAMRNAVKRLEAALGKKDLVAARSAFTAAEPVIAKAVATGVIPKATAARKLRRLNGRLKSAGAPAPGKKTAGKTPATPRPGKKAAAKKTKKTTSAKKK